MGSFRGTNFCTPSFLGIIEMNYFFIRGYKFSHAKLLNWFGSEKEVIAWIEKTINEAKHTSSSEFHYWFDRFIIK